MEKLIVYFFILIQFLSFANGEMSIQEKEAYVESYTTKIQEAFGIEYNLVEESSLKYSITALNIRDVPNTNGDIVGTFSFGEEVHITAKVEDSTWVQVSFQDKVGYCNGTYLSDTKPQLVERDGTINIVGNIPNNLIDNTYLYYYKVDASVRNRLQREGWVIYITEENLSVKFDYNVSVLAVTYMNLDTNVREIYISNRSKADKAIVHEIGHAIDYTLGFLSETQEFGIIYQEEVSSFAAWHSTHSNNYNTASEYFAESYQEYVLHPVEMQTYCPKTYEYIHNVVANFN